ncbi:uncharacterized protein RCO7_10071 [Rhynchosporium graminicola]|uniref:Uncharacterized protein n=1 Tax=Rhynchosporium graminicola TaxID=2792576 RepID=A0A1E1K915_9HELO|nr:uncharacterized protein RCO7_10071 [Rhynchosporium commune]
MLQPRSFLFTRGSAAPSPSLKSKETKNERSEGKAKPLAKRDTRDMSSTTSTTTSTESSRLTTSSSPVVIPLRGHRDTTHDRKRSQRGNSEKRELVRSERRTKNVHSADEIPPSVAALLALTSIPPQKSGSLRRRSGAGQRLTVDAILRHTGASEKEFGMSLGKSPLDLLLSPPDEEDEIAQSETGRESVVSTRTLSSDSMPSLDDEESISEASPSLNSLVTPGSGSRSRRYNPPKRAQSLPLSSSTETHPLSEVEVDELDFRVFQKSPEEEEEDALEQMEVPRRKSAFKSNLTASLKALRSAARSFSNLTTPMITPDDFLTRSIISIDPQVPFTDERMPPRLEDTPTPALRRYLNPTTNAPIEAHVTYPHTQTMKSTTCTASIQMQTYKISRPSKGTTPIVISRRTQPTTEDVVEVSAGPLARQRDMRENSDFIRVAVMEMLMRKKGKLDDQKPGRARWALPPRIPPTKAYEISEDGIPARWIAVTY